MRRLCCARLISAEAMKYNCFALSEAAGSRDSNEDFVALRPDLGIFAVADGVGGKPAGDQASRLAVRSFIATLESECESLRLTDAALQRALDHANSELLVTGQNNVLVKGLSTTLTALVLGDNNQAKVVHVGDSRLYQYSGGAMWCLTSDHNLAAELNADSKDVRGLQRWLSRALGFGTHLSVDIVSIVASPGDIFVLSTDGLAKSMSESRLRDFVKQLADRPAREICERLMLEAMSEPLDDDLTISVVKANSGPLPAQPAKEF